MLYPTELSSGGRTGFEPVADGFHRCSASELPSSAKHLLPRFGIRHGIAARTGRRCKPCRWNVFDRCSVLPAVANRQFVQAHCALCVANPASRHSRRSITTRRIAPVAATPLPRARVVAHPDASGRKVISDDWLCRTLALHALPLRTLETKRPRDLRPEGVRVASGDRGGRSPGEFDRG